MKWYVISGRDEECSEEWIYTEPVDRETGTDLEVGETQLKLPRAQVFYDRERNPPWTWSVRPDRSGQANSLEEAKSICERIVNE